MTNSARSPAVRARREPPPFRHVVVRGVERVSPRMVQVSLAGPGLEGLTVEHPAASVRLLLPAPGQRTPVVPRWEGNEFLLPDGRRPAIRTFTPLHVDPTTGALDIMIVLHGRGVASQWAESAAPGDEAAVSGPGRGYVIDPDAAAYLLAGDETAIPAISQLLEALQGAPAEVLVAVEVSHPDARLTLAGHRSASVEWFDLPPGAPAGDAMVAAVRAATIVSGTRVWAAGEAAAVQRLRRHLFEERGLSRSEATVRGYWKHGRGGDPGADD